MVAFIDAWLEIFSLFSSISSPLSLRFFPFLFILSCFIVFLAIVAFASAESWGWRALHFCIYICICIRYTSDDNFFFLLFHTCLLACAKITVMNVWSLWFSFLVSWVLGLIVTVL